MVELVVKLNDEWGVFRLGNDLIILPFHKPLCPMVWGDHICYGELILHHFVCQKHDTRPPHYHCDVHLKCSRCGHFTTFGLPIPEELFDELRKSRFHNKVLRMELKEIYGSEVPEEVKERLRSWGYY